MSFEEDFEYIKKKYGKRVANAFYKSAKKSGYRLKPVRKSWDDKSAKGVLPKPKMQEHAKMIKAFWSRYNKCKTQDSKFNLVKEYSDLVLFKFYGDGLKKRREDFLKNDTLHFDSDSECKICGSKATERHHIIQLQHGGMNVRNNLLTVCNSCHNDIHPWM